MSHWLNQIIAHFRLNEPFLIAVVCDVTGASPDAARGLLVVSKTLLASNISNDKRRNRIAREATRLLSQKRRWSDITYPLGQVLSMANGECRVIYQYFDTQTDHGWIREAQNLVDRRSDSVIAFQRGEPHCNSAVTVLPGANRQQLHKGLAALLNTGATELEYTDMDSEPSQPTVLLAATQPVLLLPVSVPLAPVVVIGRHQVAIELIRQLALLPLTVEWIVEQLLATDPLGPSVKRHKADTITIDTLAADSVLIIMTNDHQKDLSLCAQALQQPALKFVGCIGSHKKAQLVRDQLRSKAVPKKQLDKLQMPIGLPAIAGKHPALVAASVVAQILTVHQPRGDNQMTHFEQLEPKDQ